MRHDFTLDAALIRGEGMDIGDDLYVLKGYMYSFYPKGSNHVMIVSVVARSWPQRVVWMATDLYDDCLENARYFLNQLSARAVYVGDQAEVLAAIKDKGK